ncbi:conserved protein of unknown function [Candidatus Methylocalor cossyra]|uniref:DUF883 domain-containing protein n=2 Tax=Candidatus Methylocalor cossyra TaxID=3108543 RepID=A0ABP1C6P9_9GAMM
MLLTVRESAWTRADGAVLPAVLRPARGRTFSDRREVMAGSGDFGAEIAQLRRELADAKNELSSTLSSLKERGVERARQAGDVVQGQASQAQEQVGSYIEERPISSVLIAFVTGFALGSLLGIRSYR